MKNSKKSWKTWEQLIYESSHSMKSDVQTYVISWTNRQGQRNILSAFIIYLSQDTYQCAAAQISKQKYMSWEIAQYKKKIIDTGEMKYTDNFDGNLKSKYTFIFGNCLSVSLIKKKTWNIYI